MPPVADTELPRLVSQSDLRQQLGISQRQVDHIFRELPVTRLPGSRRMFVKLADVQAMLKHYTMEAS